MEFAHSKILSYFASKVVVEEREEPLRMDAAVELGDAVTVQRTDHHAL